MISLGMLLIAATSFSQTSRRSERRTSDTREKSVTTERRTPSGKSGTSVNRSNESRTRDNDRSTVNQDRRSRNDNTNKTNNSSNNNAKRTSNRSNDNSNDRGNRNSSTSEDRRRGTVNQGDDSEHRRSEATRSRERDNTGTYRQRGATTINRDSREGRSADAKNYNRGKYNSRTHVYHYDSRPNRVVHHHVNRPRPVEYRKVHHPYRHPVRINIVWTRDMYHDFRIYYPYYTNWNMRIGRSLNMISAYDAMYHAGQINSIYGQVSDVYYARETDEYILYFGPRYPYHDFSVIIPGYEARYHSRRPSSYFQGRNMVVTGLITMYDGAPEVIVRRASQLALY